MIPIPLKQIILSTVLASFLAGCSSDDDDDDSAPATDTDVTSGVDADTDSDADADADVPSGLATIVSALPVGESIGALRVALENNDALLALPVIDHQANAQANGLELRPTSVQLFGNPTLGTPLMLENQFAGLDLPQNLLAWEDADGVTNLAVNAVDYLQQRHALVSSGSEASLATISGALNNLSIVASGTTQDGTETAAPVTPVEADVGILKVVSTVDFDTTYNTLIAAIESNANLTLVAEVNHTQNAQNVGMDLQPTRLVVFGNPNLGTPLMQAQQTIGIDLPQKMLVIEDAGVVTIAYNDPVFLAERHGITGQDDLLATIGGALSGLANTAAGL